MEVVVIQESFIKLMTMHKFDDSWENTLELKEIQSVDIRCTLKDKTQKWSVVVISDEIEWIFACFNKDWAFILQQNIIEDIKVFKQE
jgi:hypothetical protein